MSRKFFIVNLSVIGIILIMSGKICKSQEHNGSERWENRRDDELHPSVILGIRTLEHIGRSLRDSSPKERTNVRRTSSIIHQRDCPINYPDSVKTDGTNDEKYNSRRQINSAVREALAKFAKIQIADRGIEKTSSRGKRLDYENTDERLKGEKFHVSTDNAINAKVNENRDLAAGSPKNEISSQESSKIFNNTRLIARKFHCRPTSEIYIPRVEEKMPAYLCKLGKKAFVISSERFSQESRESFFLSIDERTFKRLTPMNSGMTKLTSAVSVLPATLVLKRGDDDYTVRGVKQDNSKPNESADNSENSL